MEKTIAEFDKRCGRISLRLAFGLDGEQTTGKERSGMYEYTLPKNTIVSISGTFFRFAEETRVRGVLDRLTIQVPPERSDYTFPKGTVIDVSGDDFELQDETTMFLGSIKLVPAQVIGAPIAESKGETTEHQYTDPDPQPLPPPPPQDTTGPD